MNRASIEIVVYHSVHKNMHNRSTRRREGKKGLKKKSKKNNG